MTPLQVKALTAVWAVASVLTEAHFAAADADRADVTFVVALVAGGLLLHHYVHNVQGDPRMSKARSRFKLAELRHRQAEKSGDVLEIETDDGTVFELPAPGFWDDAVKQAFAGNDDVAGVRALMGPARYLEFRQRGGRADDVALALKAYAEDQGLSVGESSASQPS